MQPEKRDGTALPLEGIRDVVRTLIALADESQGGKTEDEMVTDALVPMSNGYGFWFVKPGQLGTAPLSAIEIAERIQRRLNACGERVSMDQPPWFKCTRPKGHEGSCFVA